MRVNVATRRPELNRVLVTAALEINSEIDLPADSEPLDQLEPPGDGSEPRAGGRALAADAVAVRDPRPCGEVPATHVHGTRGTDTPTSSPPLKPGGA